jgi:hypothetical protein
MRVPPLMLSELMSANATSFPEAAEFFEKPGLVRDRYEVLRVQSLRGNDYKMIVRHNKKTQTANKVRTMVNAPTVAALDQAKAA